MFVTNSFKTVFCNGVLYVKKQTKTFSSYGSLKCSFTSDDTVKKAINCTATIKFKHLSISILSIIHKYALNNTILKTKKIIKVIS